MEGSSFTGAGTSSRSLLALAHMERVIPPLSTICMQAIINDIDKKHNFSAKSINELCKIIPNHLLDPLLNKLIENNALTDVALLSFLVPGRLKIELPNVSNIKNSTFKLIGFNCPDLMLLDLSGVSRVNNSVVKAILRGCPNLTDLKLDRCVRITDQAFDPSYSPFESLMSYFSIESISLQGCPQVTGELVATLNKMCRKLKHLNLSQCKQITAPAISQIFEHIRLSVLNLAFIDNVSDDIFVRTWPLNIASQSGIGGSFTHNRVSPLQVLNLGKSAITDLGISHMTHLGRLEEIRLQWCAGITDIGIESLTINCPKLRVIDLKSCAITDVAIETIARRSTFLTTLDLSWCDRLTDVALGYLSSISIASEYNRECALEHLIVVWCCGLTEKGIFELAKVSSLKVLDCVGSLNGVPTDAPCFEAIRACGVQVIQAI